MLFVLAGLNSCGFCYDAGKEMHSWAKSLVELNTTILTFGACLEAGRTCRPRQGLHPNWFVLVLLIA